MKKWYNFLVIQYAQIVNKDSSLHVTSQSVPSSLHRVCRNGSCCRRAPGADYGLQLLAWKSALWRSGKSLTEPSTWGANLYVPAKSSGILWSEKYSLLHSSLHSKTRLEKWFIIGASAPPQKTWLLTKLVTCFGIRMEHVLQTVANTYVRIVIL